MSTFELVIDNAKIQVHCHDDAEPDHPDIVLELPAYNVWVDEFGVLDAWGNYLSVPGDGNTINARLHEFRLQNYGNGPGAPTEWTGDPAGFFPDEGDVPDGYVFSGASIIVRAQVSGDEAAIPGDWSGYYPAPTRSPFLGMDHTSAPSNLCFSGFPVGSFGNIELPNIFISGYPVVREEYDWQTTSTYDLIVDYIAARATYVWGG